jgi:hypothetical protein
VVQVDFGAVGSAGAAPNPNMGVNLQVDVRWPQFSIGLGGRDDFPASQTYGSNGGYLNTSLAVAELVPCARQGYFGECLVLVAGSQNAEGVGLPGATAGSAPFFAAGVRGLGEFPLNKRLSFAVTAEVWAPITRTDVTVGGATVWSTSLIEASLGLALVLRIF